MDIPFDFQKKIVIFGNLTKDEPKSLILIVKKIVQFATDTKTGEEITIQTNVKQRISKNWIHTIKETGKQKERLGKYPPRTITFKYRYHSKIMPKIWQKHIQWLKKRS